MLPPVSAQQGWSTGSKILLVAGGALFLIGLWYACSSNKSNVPSPGLQPPIPSPNPVPANSDVINGPVDIEINDGKIQLASSANSLDVSNVIIRDKDNKEIGQFSYKLRYRKGLALLETKQDENSIPVLHVFDIKSSQDANENRTFLAYCALLIAKSINAKEIEINSAEGYKGFRLTYDSNDFFEKKTVFKEGKLVAEDQPFCLSKEIGHELTFAQMDEKYKDLLPHNASSILPTPPPFQQIKVIKAAFGSIVDVFDLEKNPIGEFIVKREWLEGITRHDYPVPNSKPITVIKKLKPANENVQDKLIYFALELSYQLGDSIIEFMNVAIEPKTSNGEVNFCLARTDDPFKATPTTPDFLGLRAKYKDLAPSPFPEVLAPVN